MKNKIEKIFIYNGLGFPIELVNVVMVMIGGEFHPKINVREVADAAIISLVSQKERLTGNQIKFIRRYFSMSLREFSKVVNESHMAIKKWEDYGKEPTRMDLNIEIMLRLHIYDTVIVKAKNDKKEKIEFYNQFVNLTEIFSNQLKARRSHVDFQ